MRVLFCVFVAMACVPAAWGQAITDFTGGSEYDSYYGSVAGDVIGWRFSVSEEVQITDLGVWNVDQTGGIESPHIVGVWDGSQALMDSVTVDGSGTVVGDWIYASVTPIIVSPGETYTIGALYFSGDSDWYISSATNVTTDPGVTWIESVYPFEDELGFAYPELSTSSFGRFGPNFLFETLALQQSTWGEIKATF